MSAASILVITRSAPYGSSAARDALDVALTCSVFEQPVSLLFLDDAVFQLLKGQSPGGIGQKNLNAVQQSLPLYDIDRLYVGARALAERGLHASDLILPVQTIDEAELASLLADHTTVLSV
jgi:tRNA 2-thiouridine synthesizing protein C